MGRNMATVNKAIIVPDWLFNVICHTIAYCTTIVPKNDRACPVRKRAVFIFQLGCIVG
jgi:hypothetical protein